MPKHDIAALRMPQPLARLREREEHAEFLIRASELLMRTSRLVASGQNVEKTLESIAGLLLPHDGVWSIVAITEGDTSRQIPVAQTGWRDRSGSVLTVALTSHGNTLGSMTFIAPFGGHVFDDRDRQLAQDVAEGAALAIVNSRLAANREESRGIARRTAADRHRFIESLSHGLRTPLHAIHGYAQLLDENVRGPLTDGQRHDVHRIQANERHLLNLVTSVIGFARWDDGEALALEDISVRTAVRLTSAVVERAASKSGVSYLPDRDALDATLMVRAEPLRLREILLQLLLNAVRFSRPRDSIFVRALTVGEQVWIRVTDTGIGIESRKLDSIFKPFLNARNDQDGAEHGVGLGLAITQNLARSMGGELSAVSEYGKGSTFTLALPGGRAA